MAGMFEGASAFNGDLSNGIRRVLKISDIRSKTHVFNGNISTWDTSSATTMAGMFDGASAFNGDLSEWDTSSATTMAGMFEGASAFNGDLSNEYAEVEDFGYPLKDATSFNGNISTWIRRVRPLWWYVPQCICFQWRFINMGYVES